MSVFDEGNKYWITKAGGRAEVISRAAAEAMDYLIGKFGKNPVSWKWEDIHTVRFPHAVNKLKVVIKLFIFDIS